MKTHKSKRAGLAISLVALGGLTAPGVVAVERTITGDRGKDFAVMTFASNEEQIRSVRALIRSIRELGGAYQDCRIYVVLSDLEGTPKEVLDGKGVEILPLEMDRAFLDYPLALKAFAAAQVEALVEEEAGTLAWFDPGVLVLGSPGALDLEGRFDAALRPVFLLNTIGLPPGAEPNDYWAPIYRSTGLDHRTVPAYKTVVDEAEIQPYFNCQVFSLDPRLGLCREWADILEGLLREEDYQHTSCTTFLRKLFLHQAVLSGVIASRVKEARLKPLPMACGYPFNQHDKMPEAKRVSALNDAAVVIFDETWAQDPEWMKKIPVHEPLKTWLAEAYREYLEPTGGKIPVP